MIHKKKFKNTQTSNNRIYSIYHHNPLTILVTTLLLSSTINQQNIDQPLRNLAEGQPVDIYTQYGDLSIVSLDPNRGPNTGETRVMVRGKSSYGGLYQNYRTPANWVCLQCENSPESNNTVSTNVTFEISITGEFNDFQLPNQNFKSTFEYYPPPEITEIIPPYGQKDGTTNVTVIGKNFENYGNHTRCSFGENTTQAYFISSTKMYCISTFSHVVNRPMPFSVSLNNQQFSPSNISYWYYNWPQISELIPPKGPWFGGTNVTLKGKSFKPFNDSEIDNTKDRYCLFDFQKNANPSNKYYEYQITRFQPITKAYIESSTTAYCVTPEWVDEIDTAWVELTLNNQEYTDDQKVFHYYMIPRLIDVNPREGPVPGGTRLTAIGENFKNDGNVTCKFTKKNDTHTWTKIMPGRVQTSSEIICESPPSDMPGYVDLAISLQTDVYSEPVKYLYYEMPIITSIVPTCGPDYGYTQITVFGKNFWDLGSNKALCVFNKTIFTNATIFHQDLLKCDSPTLYDNQGYSKLGQKDIVFYDIEVTIDGGRYLGGPYQRFFYYKDPIIQDIIPNSGPKRGGTLVRIAGSGLNHTCHCNKTARFATWEVKPINESSEHSMFVLSPAVEVADTVVVAHAGNGQQFTRDYIIHVKDDENTFDYYDDPIVTGYNPKTGPSIGGTRVRIQGYGFTPKKNKDGEVDKSKNKMWVRFVDPNDPTKELSPATQVNPDDLSDEEAFWKTPAQPSGTKALMQVSLNGQDYTNIVPPGKPYSFAFYESPHIDVLHPAFGPVKAKVQNYVYIEGRNFICPDVNCTLLKVRWMDPQGNYIYVRGEWLNVTFVRCLIPKYPKPEELVVELTLNEQDYTNDKKRYGYFDPYVLNAEPRLISVLGTTKVSIKGFGFVNSSATKALFNSTYFPINCQLANCIKPATYIDSSHLITSTFPQTIVNYNNGSNILWDAMTIEAAVYEDDFTENNLQLWYYEDPDYQGLSPDESPANVETPIFIKTDFKTNPIERLQKFSNFTCRFKSEDGRIKYTKGYLVRYPLEYGKAANPNNVRCKSPIWKMTKNQETVKLDIALNGQDFSGGFDFTFYEELMLHRDLPMSGPVQGSTLTKLFGTGFKPRKGVANIKWGVFSTVEIIKEQVESCIWHQDFEYSSDTCDDLLKTEIWDDTRFPTMYEHKNYTTIYHKSLEVWNWTKTQGGPYFLEVGMNHTINFMRVQNQSIYEGNITVNGTSVAQYSYVSVPTVQSWIYYDYIYSTVYYWFYKDLVVKEIFPHSAKVQGGTLIQIAGAWFKDMPWHGVFPHCKFGDKIVRGFFDSTVRVACTAPPGNEIGQELPIEVSLNGVDFSNSGFSFSYYSQPILDRITPTSGKEQGGNPIYIIGKSNFTKMDNPNEFNCKFTPISFSMPPKKVPAIYENNTHIRCQQSGGWGKGGIIRVQVTFNGQDYDDNNFLYTMFSVYKVYPRSAPYDTTEEEEITIEGAGFISENMPACKMNGTVYNASYFTDTIIKCPILKINQTKAGWVNFDVAPNGADWSGFTEGFYFYKQPIVYSISPPQGPAKGKGLVTFFGEGFQTKSSLQEPKCKIGNSYGTMVSVTDEYMQCQFENIELTAQDEPLASQVALNAYSYTYLNETTYYIPYGIEYFSPNSGPENGYIDVYVHGKGFEQMTSAQLDGNYYYTEPKCRFGSPDNNAIVDAQIVSYDKLLCRLQVDFQLLPSTKYPIDIPFAVALSGNESNSPWTETYHKFRLYDYPNIVTCEPAEVEIGTVTDVLLYADDIGGDFFDPILVNNTGNLQNPIMCKFGRFGETEAIYINEKVLKCRTPTIEDDPSSIYREEVLVTVAMNGKDFDEEHSTVLFTFIGTGTYLVFWQILVVVMLFALIIAAIIVCISTLFNRLSRDDGSGREGQPYVFNIGGGLMVPRGRADWNAERSSVDILEKASGNNF